jgi:hypothetical protein
MNIEVWRIPNTREYTLSIIGDGVRMVRVAPVGWIKWNTSDDVSRRMVRWHSEKDAKAAMRLIPQ